MNSSRHDHDAWEPGDGTPDSRTVPDGNSGGTSDSADGDEGLMEFGEVSEAVPETCLRPDQNKHFQTLPVGSPREDDLPIYIDLDALKDMEIHALSDTRVELGGVMLGGQYLDEEGQPFVVITDSLRAQHYESTKGSFKFTHETWEQITREREDFPPDLQMVGWYHTHPDWGVFLSGMDMFICDHFFNRPLDVALVIDPCRDDRGMFQWTPTRRERVRRTSGFYLIASRFREAELVQFVEVLEGRSMTADPRYAGSGHVSYPAPVIHLTDNRASSQNILLGMLAAQFLLLVLLAWGILMPAGGGAAGEGTEAADDPLAQLEKKIEELSEARVAADHAQTQLRVMDRVLSKIGDTQPGFLEQLAAKEEEVDQLQAAIRGHRVYEKDLEKQLASFDDRLKRIETEAEFEQKALEKKYDDLVASFKGLKEQRDELKVENARYRKKLGLDAKKDKEDEEEQDSFFSRYRWALIFSAALFVLILAAVFASVSAKRPENGGEDLPAEDDEEGPPGSEPSPPHAP